MATGETETIIEQLYISEIIIEPGSADTIIETASPIETVIETVRHTELVTENIGPRGPASLVPGLDDLPSLKLIFENHLI